MGNCTLQVGNWSARAPQHTGRRNTGKPQQAHSHKPAENCGVRTHRSRSLSFSWLSRTSSWGITEVYETVKISCRSRQSNYIFGSDRVFFMFCEVTETLNLRDEEIVRNTFQKISANNKREHQALAHP